MYIFLFCYEKFFYICCLVFFNFQDTIFITSITSSNAITEVSPIFFKILATLKNTCARIPTIIFFACTIIFMLRVICFIIPFSTSITSCTIEFAFTIPCSVFCHCFSFIFIFYHIKYFNIYGTFGDKTLQLPPHLSKLIVNGSNIISKGFKSMRVGLTMHGSLFEDIHFAAKYILKFNNTINTCLIKLSIVLYHS